MNLVDSSAWLEFFADGPNAGFFAPPIEQIDSLLVSAITIYEVFKRVLQLRGEDDALTALVQMRRGQVIPLDDSLATLAAKTSAETKLAMADSIILATARTYDAILWTQDADFAGLEKVQYRPKQ